MKKEMPIHRMVDNVFQKGIEDLIDEIAQERTFVVNTLKEMMNDDALWQEMVTNKESRKMFIWSIQELTLQEIQTNHLIELTTIKHGED